jgi:hypothetical protein
MASEMNKSKRQIVLKLALLTGITEIVWQVTSYSAMFEVGSLRLIRGKITILPVDCDTQEQQRGLLQVAPFRNGNLPDQDLFCGFMGSVSHPISALSQGLMIITYDSGRRKERSLVCRSFDISVSKLENTC